MGKTYKQHKKGAGRHVQLPEWLLASDAWASLKPGPRALYVELKRRFNGHNNGELFLSHRDAAKLMNVGRDTVGKYYTELQDVGFLQQTVGHCLGPSGRGQSAKWALTEHPLNGAPATKEFIKWRKHFPRKKIQLSLAG